MTRWFLPLVLLLTAEIPASAHFLWVVPQPDGQTAHVIVSETLGADTRVDMAIALGASLEWRDSAKKDSRLTLTRAGYVLTVPLVGKGLAHGHADLGVRPSGERAYRLHYYPKAIVGDPFATEVVTGKVPIEIVPVGKPGAMRLKVLVAGKPTAGVDVNLLLPDGSEETVQTEKGGVTEVLTAVGRYGAWARHWEQVSGTFQGKAFDQTRHYATLVVDAGAAPATSSSAAAAVPVATKVATMPEAASSFGAVASEGWLYVYGGHVVPTHSYSTAAVSGRFSRLKLAEPGSWETLPTGPKLQGMNLAVHGKKVYRVGGMQPLNQPGEPSDTHSIADVAGFDPAMAKWESLAPLPLPRSSHDVVVVGDQLFVIGGWQLKGKEKSVWPETMEVMDLSAASPTWRSIPQPFKRRAFVAAADSSRIYVVGGFDDKSAVVKGVSIYDVAKGTWSDGPALPGGALNGFGAAAVTLDGRLFVSIDAGGLYRLNDTGTGWDKVGQATPRIVHRIAAEGKRVFVIGGAGDDGNSDLVEAITVAP